MGLKKEDRHKSRYYTNKSVRERIDSLLHKNAAFVAQNICVTMSSDEQAKMYKDAEEKFLLPIKDLDADFYEEVK